MPQNWYIEAEKALEPGDTIQKSYSGRLDKNSGYLVISKNRLIFVNVKGFISKTYSIIMNLSIDKISEIKPLEWHELEISSNGNKYRIDTGDLSAKRVQLAIDEVREMVVVS
jgi:hypothetical protein